MFETTQYFNINLSGNNYQSRRRFENFNLNLKNPISTFLTVSVIHCLVFTRCLRLFCFVLMLIIPYIRNPIFNENKSSKPNEYPFVSSFSTYIRTWKTKLYPNISFMLILLYFSKKYFIKARKFPPVGKHINLVLHQHQANLIRSHYHNLRGLCVCTKKKSHHHDATWKTYLREKKTSKHPQKHNTFASLIPISILFMQTHVIRHQTCVW